MATQFATAFVMEEDSYEAGKEAAKKAMPKLMGFPPQLAVFFCSTRYDYSAVMRGIQSLIGEQVPIIGCTSAGQFTDEGIVNDGIVCALIASDTHLFFNGIGTQLKSDPFAAIQNSSRTFPKDVAGYPHQSAILLVDGLACRGEEAVLSASSILGPSVRFSGGAAADNFVFRETLVFGQGEALSDAISLCLIASRSPVIISFKHGHHPISPPFKITKAKENILYELDGRPALEVWKDTLRDRLKKEGTDVDKISLPDFSKILLKYEAGLMTGPDEYKIRFPASCNADGSLNFVCTMLEGSVIKIMNSTNEDQIETARLVAEDALKLAGGSKIAGAIIFECACRAMILEDRFPEAIQASKQVLGSLPFIGCETYGEIAMEKGKYSGFHNTSTAIMLFPY